MTYLIVLALYVGILWLLAWLSRRSMGMATVALAAGALLANLWTDSLTPLVAQTGVVVIRPPLTSIVAIVLTLLPAVLVLARAPKVKSHGHGVASSFVFALLAVMLTYGAFSNAVVLDEISKTYALLIVQYQNIIITTCVAIGVIEVLVYHKPRRHDEHKK